MKHNMKDILVTGSEGYIATNLIPKLEERGYNVIGLDIKGDPSVNIAKDFSKYIGNCDGIIHLAAISGIADCEKDVNKTVEYNIKGTENVLSFMRQRNVDENRSISFVFASTQAAKKFSNLYGHTKRISETKIFSYNVLSASNIKVLRFCNVYGGKEYLERKTTALSNFIKCKLNNTTAIINGDGKQTRDFIHVDDICDAIIKALEYKDKYIRPIDIGTGNQTSVLQIAKDIIQCKYEITNNDKAGESGSPIDPGISYRTIGFYAERSINDIMKEYEDVQKN